MVSFSGEGMNFQIGDLFVGYNNSSRFIGILIEIDELNDIYAITWQREKGPVYETHLSKVLLSVNISAHHYQYFPVKS
jgi:hypothetical protein